MSVGVAFGYSVFMTPFDTTLEDVIVDIEATGLSVVENVKIESPSIIFIVDDLEEFLTISEQLGAEEIYLDLAYTGSFYCFDEGFAQAWRFTSEYQTRVALENRKAILTFIGAIITGIGAVMLIMFSVTIIREK